jgi:hypothetical protein
MNMGMTDNASGMTTADFLELNAIGEAIFAEWCPNHRTGDPVPPNPPLHGMRKARELGNDTD